MICKGSVPKTIVEAATIFLKSRPGDASVKEIAEGVVQIYGAVSASSVGNCLSSNTPKLFERTARGRYRSAIRAISASPAAPSFKTTAPPILKMAKREAKAAPTVLELCAGGGGMALGIEQARFEPQALIELDPHACATLRRNRPYWNVVQADIRRFDASYWRDTDLLSGGLPCPPFSIAGKQLGAEDDRDMFPPMLRIVKQVKPRAVLIENVRGILTERFSSFRARVDAALNKQGFDTYWMGFTRLILACHKIDSEHFLSPCGVAKPSRWNGLSLCQERRQPWAKLLAI